MKPNDLSQNETIANTLAAKKIADTAIATTVLMGKDIGYMQKDIAMLQMDMKKILENHLPHLETKIEKLNTKITLFTAINIGGIILGIIISKFF